MDYLFVFEEFILGLKRNEEKEDMIREYEKVYGSIEDCLEDNIFWKDYLSTFKIPDVLVKNLKVMESLRNDYDMDLLIRLIAASFSSSYRFHIAEDGVELLIMVSAESGKTSKRLDELWGYQTQRLYEIYFEELIGLYSLLDSQERKCFEAKKIECIEKFDLQMTSIHSYYGKDDDMLIDFSVYEK